MAGSAMTWTGGRVCRVSSNATHAIAKMNMDFGVPLADLGNMSPHACGAYANHVQRVKEQAKIAKKVRSLALQEFQAVEQINEAAADITKKGLKSTAVIDKAVAKTTTTQLQAAADLEVLMRKTEKKADLIAARTTDRLNLVNSYHDADKRLLGAKARAESDAVRRYLRSGLSQQRHVKSKQLESQRFNDIINGRNPQGGIGGGGFWGGVGRLLGFA